MHTIKSLLTQFQPYSGHIALLVALVALYLLIRKFAPGFRAAIQRLRADQEARARTEADRVSRLEKSLDVLASRVMALEEVANPKTKPSIPLPPAQPSSQPVPENQGSPQAPLPSDEQRPSSSAPPPVSPGVIAKGVAWFKGLKPMGKAMVAGVVILMIVAANKHLGAKSASSNVVDDDDATESSTVKSAPAKSAAAPKVEKVNPCAACKPDLTAGGVVDTNASGYVWANACTGSGDCGNCKPVAACTTTQELGAAPPACNACVGK